MAGQKTHLKNCTAEYFTTTWKKYDADGNGYIEDKELKSFLTDLAKKEDPKTQMVTDIDRYTRTFMAKYDKNKDGKIDMRELAEVLQPEENFLCLIRTEPGPDSVHFKQIWNRYDTDASGYIEASELKNFLRDAFASHPLTEPKLDEYTQAALALYDKDGNHKLDFNEMIKLLPLATNYLKSFQFGKLTQADFESIFAHYDKNNDKCIEDSELNKLLGDILHKEGLDATPAAIAGRKKALMPHCDKNKDGKIQLSELKFLFKFSK